MEGDRGGSLSFFLERAQPQTKVSKDLAGDEGLPRNPYSANRSSGSSYVSVSGRGGGWSLAQMRLGAADGLSQHGEAVSAIEMPDALGRATVRRRGTFASPRLRIVSSCNPAGVAWWPLHQLNPVSVGICDP